MKSNSLSWLLVAASLIATGCGATFESQKSLSSQSASEVKDPGPIIPAPIVVAGVCGTSNNMSFAAAPASNLCASGTASVVAGGGPFTWSCAGANGGASASCSAQLSMTAPTPVAGVCGAAHNTTVAVAPSANLCATGTASVVSGMGPYTWTCAGLNGGATASCMAQKSMPPTSGPIPTVTPAPAPGTPVRSSPNPGQWVNTTSNLANYPSECGNMSYISSNPREDMMIVGVAGKGLFSSRNGGASWQALGAATPEAMLNRPITIAYDPVAAGAFWVAGIYTGRGIFRTDNNGQSFRSLGSIGHNDSVSIDFNDPNRQTLLAGSHEQKQEVFLSQNGGQTWRNIGTTLPTDSAFSSFPLVVNSQTFFLGANLSWGDDGGRYSSNAGGIFQTNNAGATWTKASGKGGAAEPLVARDGNIYWISDDGGMVRGLGSGANWTWTEVTSAGRLAAVKPVELHDGRIAAVGRNNSVLISSDKGITWQTFGPQMPFAPTGITYSQFDRAFYIWYFTCGGGNVPVPANAIAKLYM